MDHYSFCYGLSWSAEAFNSAIEKLCDKVEPEKDPIIGKVKDMAAAGVLFLAIAAAIVGCIIFLPKIF
jgi:diacylglycerol kinase (ATP)